MFERLTARIAAAIRRIRRIERRELAEFRIWVEETDNLLHLSVLFVLPLLVVIITELANTFDELLPVLLFPPLASGAYTLFANPGGKYSHPARFVVGLTVGAACGWAALGVDSWLPVTPESALVTPISVALSLLLTGVVTWALGVEQPSAFSSALLVLAAPEGPVVYVGFILVGGTLVAGTFALWRAAFYKERARYLYGTTHADDHVLVPIRGETALTTALFGARLAAAHDAGKVVLVDVVSDEAIAAAERSIVEGERGDGTADADTAEGIADIEDEATREVTTDAAHRLEEWASTIRTRVGVPCEVVVARGEPATTTLETARASNCDLVVTPYEEDRGLLSEFVRSVFRGPVDTVAFRSETGKQRWRRVLVAVSRPGDSAHAMVDFATRLAGRSGSVSVCTCIDREVERRPAENTLSNVVEAVEGPIETRVARADVLDFLDANAGSYDLLLIGSSGGRSAASRAIAPPTFEKLRDIDCDVGVVDRGAPGAGR